LLQALPSRFSEWRVAGLPAAPGTYTVWDGTAFLYAGMAGRNGKSGLRGRLSSHALGRRSGDQFCIYVCDRLILPTLTLEQIQQVGEGRILLDALTREYIRDRLSFRWLLTTTGAEALDAERYLRRGALGMGKPALNPL
jgi:hypothetical protein